MKKFLLTTALLVMSLNLFGMDLTFNDSHNNNRDVSNKKTIVQDDNHINKKIRVQSDADKILTDSMLTDEVLTDETMNTSNYSDLKQLQSNGTFVNLKNLTVNVNHLIYTPIESMDFPNLTTLTIQTDPFPEIVYDHDIYVEIDSESYSSDSQNYIFDKYKNLQNLISKVSSNLTTLNIIGEIYDYDIENYLEMFNKLKYLSLADTDFCNIPQSVFSLTNLISLSFTFSEVYDWHTTIDLTNIGNLVNLKYLNLSGCGGIGNLTKKIGDLRNLEELILDSSNTKSLPKSIGNLTHLTKLDISSCDITSIPKEIGNLRNLKSLIMTFNDQITEIPEELWILENLKEIKIDGKFWLEDISPSSKVINYSKHNFNLKTLPIGLMLFQYIKNLDLSYNNLEKIPTLLSRLNNLEYIDLRGNNEICSIYNIPKRFLEHDNLKSMILSIIPSPNDPYGIKLQRDNKAIVLGKDNERLWVDVAPLLLKNKKKNLNKLNDLFNINILTYLNFYHNKTRVSSSIINKTEEDQQAILEEKEALKLIIRNSLDLIKERIKHSV